MEICTIGFTKKPAEVFFGLLIDANVRRLVDIRLNNTSQMAGFTKAGDLPYLLRAISGIDYVHETILAPTQELLEGYRKEQFGWDKYEKKYLALLKERDVASKLKRKDFEKKSVLLCSEHEPDHCHRRLAAEFLAGIWPRVSINHL